MDSKEELAQPVGNAKIRGEFDTDAATAVGSNTHDAVLFPRSRSDHDGNMTGLSLVGTVLARRYKILGIIDGDRFKAHDLALDQTVTVRQAMLTGQPDGDTWLQKVQQLALVRDPNFLNVLDVFADKAGYFVITEAPPESVDWRAIALRGGRRAAVDDSLGQRSRLCCRLCLLSESDLRLLAVHRNEAIVCS